MPTTARPPCSGWGSCPYDRHAVKRLGPAFDIVMLLEMQIPCRGNIAVVASADIAEIVDLVEFLIELEGACIQTGHVAVVFFHPGDVKDDDPRLVVAFGVLAICSHLNFGPCQPTLASVARPKTARGRR